MSNYTRIHPAITLGVAAAWTLLLGFIFVAAILLDWPGELDPMLKKDKTQLYGEELHMDSAIKQPWSTWSDLGFVVGGWAMLMVACFCGDRNPANPMATSSLPSLFFGLVFIYLGPGSMFFHAGGTKWGGVLDGLSMCMFMSFVFFYDLWRVVKVPAIAAISIWSGLMILSFVLMWFHDALGKIFLAVWMVATLGMQILIHPEILDVKFLGVELRASNLFRGWEPGGGHFRRNVRWLALALALFALAIIPWILTQKGNAYYDLKRTPPGHFWWHLFSSGAVFSLYLYYRSEKVR